MAVSRARELHLAARRYRYDPLAFARLVVPFGRAGTSFERWRHLWPWQVEFFASVAKEVYAKRFGPDENGDVKRKAPVLRSLSSGTGTGKSSVLLPALIFWVLACYPGSRVLAVSPSREHLGDKLFANCRTLLQASPFLRRYFDSSSEGTIWVKGFRERAAIFRTAVSKEALSGTHAPSGIMMVVFDDAAGVLDESFVATDGARSDPQVIAVAAGQPTRLEGWFWRVTHGPLAALWNVQIVSLLDMPDSDDELRARKALEHDGEDSMDFRVMVLGLPPLLDAMSFIPVRLLEEAMSRPLFDADSRERLVSVDTPVVVGMDLAREGEAENCAVWRAGIDLRSVAPERIRGRDLSASARVDWAIDCAERAREPYGVPCAVYYDSTGLDGAFDDALQRRAPHPEKFHPVNFAAADPAKRFTNKRALMWGALRRWMNAGGVLRADPVLKQTLAAARSEWKNERTMGINPKEEIRAVAGASHLDEVDALLLSMGRPPDDAVVSPALLPPGGRARTPRWTTAA